MYISLLSIAAGASLLDIDGTIFIQLGIFIFMFLILHFALFKPVVRLIEVRHDATLGVEREAARMDEECNDINFWVDEKLAEIKEQAVKEQKVIVEQAGSEAFKIINKAAQISEDRIEKSVKELMDNAQSVRRGLAGDVDAMAEAVALAILDKKV